MRGRYLNPEGVHHHEVESVPVGQQLGQAEPLQLHSLDNTVCKKYGPERLAKAPYACQQRFFWEQQFWVVKRSLEIM